MVFDKLNNLNINYSSIFYNLTDINKINYLKEININFNKIKKLIIESDYDEYEDEDEDEDEDEVKEKEKEKDNIKKNQIKNFFEILFSINNIENNLIYLKIKFKHCQINPEILEKINNFKLLRQL